MICRLSKIPSVFLKQSNYYRQHSRIKDHWKRKLILNMKSSLYEAFACVCELFCLAWLNEQTSHNRFTSKFNTHVYSELDHVHFIYAQNVLNSSETAAVWWLKVSFTASLINRNIISGPCMNNVLDNNSGPVFLKSVPGCTTSLEITLTWVVL